MYRDEDGNIVTDADLAMVWQEMTEEEKAEYSGNFGYYVSACMSHNGGTLSPISEEVLL